MTECRHVNRTEPLYSAAKLRQWFRCKDCGLYAWRYFGEKRVRLWGRIVGEFSQFLPDPELTAQLEDRDG